MFLFYVLSKELAVTPSETIEDIILNKLKTENIEVCYRLLDDIKVPIYIYTNEYNENVALMELQKHDKINLFRFLLLEQDEKDIVLSKDLYCNKFINHIKLINNRLYINLLGDFDIIEMNGYIENFGNITEKKLTLSDTVSNKTSLGGILFMTMINTFVIMIVCCGILYNSYIMVLSGFLGSFITIFDCNYNLIKDIIHYTSAFGFFFLFPYSTLQINNIILNYLSIMTIILTIIFIIYVGTFKYLVYRNLNKENKNIKFEVNSTNNWNGRLILSFEFFLMVLLSIIQIYLYYVIFSIPIQQFNE